MTALLQMVDAFPVVALAELLPNQPAHHDLDPLLPDDGILGLLEALGVVVVDSVKGGRDGGLLGQEGRGFGGRHCVLLSLETGAGSGLSLIGLVDVGLGGDPPGGARS